MTLEELSTIRNQVDTVEDMWAVLKLFDEFLLEHPSNLAAMHNRSDLLKHLGLYELALKETERVLALKPDFALAWCNKAFILNALGAYREGWAAYEWRFKTNVPTFQDPNWPIPRWLGEDIAQAKLLIYAEQGFGDNIQFVRYAIEAKKRGMNIVVVNHKPLENLLNYNLACYNVESSLNGHGIGGLEYYVSMMSLPHYFGTTLDSIPNSSTYLVSEPHYFEKWKDKLSSSHRLKVGIVWSGSVQHNRNKIRSLRFQQVKQLFVLNAEFHCLQKVVTAEDAKSAQSFSNLYFWQDELVDFSDTAGLIAQLDLVISVDTSVAHLAAAMGKPTWILISYHPDFRWLLNREDSPWYQSVKLFRQDASQKWDGVLTHLYNQLQLYLQENKNV